MQIDIGIKIDGKEHKGLMGISLEDIQKPVVVKKKKKKKENCFAEGY